MVVIYLIVGVVHLQPGVRGLWRDVTGGTGLAVPDVSRGRIFIPASEAATYRRVTSLLRAHARGGATIAGPDAPEIYFLADLRNPTPMIYDFLTRTSMRDHDILDCRSPRITSRRSSSTILLRSRRDTTRVFSLDSKRIFHTTWR